MQKHTIRQGAVLLTTIATIAVNALANILPLNGLNTGQISDMFPVLFTPAGYVFSVWSVIYVGLIAYSIYQALPAQRDDPRLQTVGWLYVAGSVANIIWIVLWHYLYTQLTVFFMIGLLASLIAIYMTLGIGRRPVSLAEKLTTHIPFSIYLGWITVATVANVSVVLYDAGWNGFGLSAQTWTIIMLAAATLISFGVAVTRADAAYLLVPTWAFVGIAVARADMPSVVTAAMVAAVVTGVLALLSLIPQGPLPLTQQRTPSAASGD